MIHWMRRRLKETLISAAVSAAAVSVSSAQESPASDDALPRPVDSQHFAALMENSPFTRSLNLSDSLILTGVAIVDGKQVATLMNKKTKETYVVSDQPNIQGWKMVGYAGDEDLEKVAAKITVAGGEVVTVRYDDWSLKPGETRPGGGGSGGEVREGERRFGHGDGRGKGGPGSEMFSRIRSLSEEQRMKLFDKMRKIREENPNMSREDMRPHMEKVLEKMEKK
jgi:hypothetical protein